MFSPVSWQQYLQWTQNNLQSAKNKTASDVKRVSKPLDEHFCQYLGNDSFEQLKVTSKVLKIEELIR